MQNFVLIQKNYGPQRALRARKVDNWSVHRSSLWTAGLTPGAPVDHPGLTPSRGQVHALAPLRLPPQPGFKNSPKHPKTA
jgi:hypothetical protein